ncbi:MAG: hypothetical protein Q9191_006575 [Dirinaria sp. TL-2023a]
MAKVIYSDVAATNDLQGDLFRDIKFWLSQRANGGKVVPLDKQADVMIVDHARKEAPPGSYSYTFIEKSIRNGSLEDLEDHQVGPPLGSVRSIGSIAQPAKTTRNKFTEEDDRVLLQWVYSHPQKGGGTEGNEIYKQLEAQNARHTWQSWRDRWVKTLKGTPRPPFVPTNAPPTPPSDYQPPQSDIEMVRASGRKRAVFTEVDAEVLLEVGADILNIRPEKADEAWEKFASKQDVSSVLNQRYMADILIYKQTEFNRSGKDWRDFWEKSVRELYVRRRRREYLKADTAISNTEPRAHVASGRRTHPAVVSRRSSPRPQDKNPDRSQRSPSIQPQSSKASNRSPSLPIRSPLEVKPSDQPSPDVSRVKVSKVIERLRHPATEAANGEELPLFLPEPSPERSEPLKKKRGLFVEDELPSSSPPGMPIPRSASPKRLRRETPGSKRLEIASTPDNSPHRSTLTAELFLGARDAETVNISDGEEETESEGTDVNDGEDQGDASLLGRPASPTLSSPSRTIANSQLSPRPDTQAVFEDTTQLVDLEVPPPEEGWDEEDEDGDEDDDELEPVEPDPNSQLIDSPPAQVIPETQPKVPDTQHLFDSKTQVPDFALAEPDGGWDTLDLPSSPPRVTPDERSSPVPAPPRAARSPTPSPELLTTSINRFLDDHVSVGYAADDCLAALKATSIDLELAVFVLRYMTKRGKGRIPRHERGIWTQDDDSDLEASDARKVERVYQKHGTEAVERRWEFWRAWRELGEL